MQEKLIRNLSDFVKRTEKVYTSIAERYPAMLESMNQSLADAEKMVSGFRGSDPTDKTLDYRQAVGEWHDVFENSETRFSEIMDEDGRNLSALHENIEKIADLKIIVSEIREISEEMELISLNSMVVALKAGKEGGGFSVVTDKLRAHSGKTIDYTRRLNTISETISRYFTDFQELADSVHSGQQAMVRQFSDQIATDLKAFVREVDDTMRFLQGLLERSASIKPPLYGIMEEIQYHDIIRQAIEQITHSLAGADFETDGSTEGELDYLSFALQVQEISLLLLADIEERIRNSLKQFTEKTGVTRTIIDTLIEERKRFMNERSNEIRTRTSSEESTDTLLVSIQEMDKKRKTMSTKSLQILEQVMDINTLLARFAGMGQYLKSITIASKIEVAKQQVLRGMKDTVVDLENMTDLIESKVEIANGKTESFIRDALPVLQKYEECLGREETFINTFHQNFESIKTELQQLEERISRFLGGFQIFTDEFITLFRQTGQELQELSLVIDAVAELRVELEHDRDEMQRLLTEAKKNAGIEEWTLHDSGLAGIIENFTIFTHKKQAGDISGVDIENESMAEGEVTLF